MEVEHSYYDFNRSIERIDEILFSPDSNYDKKKSIPNRDLLTFNNGFYVSASALFVDIRESKKLNNNYDSLIVAKIYKTYISEVVAVLKDNDKVNEIYIEGDGVWAMYDTPLKSDIDNLLCTSAKISSIVDILNLKYSKIGFPNISIGIGLSYGESLYIKAGYKGSGINEVAWLGKLVGEASELSSYGNKTIFDSETMVSNDFYINLKDDYKTYLDFNLSRNCFNCNIINVLMNQWVQNNG